MGILRDINEESTSIENLNLTKRKIPEETNLASDKKSNQQRKALSKLHSAKMVELATKGLAVILICLWTFVCEADPTKDKGEKDDLASIKKKLAEQEKQLAEQKSDFSKQLAALQKSDSERQKREKTEKTDLAQQLKKLQEEFAKEKISAFKLRKADKELLQAELDLRQADEAERAENNALRTKIATNRQEDEKRELDVVSEMKRLLRAEIKSDDTKELIEEEIGKYLNTHSVCQMGETVWNNPSKRENSEGKKITFAPPFPKTPKAQAALSLVSRDSTSGTQAVAAFVGAVSATKTGMQFTVGTAWGTGVRAIEAMWIACL